MKQGVAALLLIAIALAGCTADNKDSVQASPGQATMSGHVFTEALFPIEGATVIVGGTNASTTTDAQGAYFLTAPPGRDFYTLRFSANGYFPEGTTLEANTTAPKFVQDMVLRAVPREVPEAIPQAFDGNIACAFFVQAEHSHGGPGDPGAHNSTDCSDGSSEDVWVFTLQPGVRNVIIEMFWEPNTILSERLAMFVEGVGVDDGEDALLYFDEGPTGVRAIIGQLQASSFYREEGGEVRVTVKIGAPEEDFATGVAVNQQFRIFATAFYLVPGPSNYSVVDN